MKKYLILNILLSLSILSFGQAPGSFNISGQVICGSGGGIGATHIVLTLNGQLIDSLTSDQNGNYQFLNVPVTIGTSDYQIEASKFSNPLNGVSTFDMVLATKHILGIESLSPIQVLAADINRSGTLTTFDLVQMRALILFSPLVSSIPSPDWIFYQEINGQIQTGPLTVSGNSGNQTVNILGIKRGDVNGSAICTN